MAHDDRTGVLGVEAGDEGGEGAFLCFRARVGIFAIAVKTALVAYADGVAVVVHTVGTHLFIRSPLLDGSVAPHHVVVADASPSLVLVPFIDLFRRTGLIRSHCGAVDDDQGDRSHLSHTTRCSQGGEYC